MAQVEGGGLGWGQQPCPFPTYALGPSFLRICRPQSHVLRYLCASRPCRTPAAAAFSSQSHPFPAPPPSHPHLHPSLDHVQRSVPEDTGCARDGSKHTSDERVHGLVGVVPWMGVRAAVRRGQRTRLGGRVLGHRRTSVPVAQGGHDEEANGLVGSLLQHGGREALVRPLQPWGRQALRSH